MSHKGAAATVSLLILGAILSTIIAGIGIDRIDTLEQSIRAETVQVPASRIQNGLIMVNSLEEGSLEMEFTSEYNITQENGDFYLAYENEELGLARSKTVFKSKINETENFDAEIGRDNKICINKDGSQPVVSPGECQ